MLLGYISDGYSRKAGMVFTSALVVIGSLMATLALKVQHLGTANMLWYLTVVRGIAGVGVGGEFPAGATVSVLLGVDSVDRKLKVISRLHVKAWRITTRPIVDLFSSWQRPSSHAGEVRYAFSCT